MSSRCLPLMVRDEAVVKIEAAGAVLVQANSPSRAVVGPDPGEE